MTKNIYPTVMYLAIAITLILILFSFVNIFKNLEPNPIDKKININKITGFAVSEISTEQKSELKNLSKTVKTNQTEMYSLKAYSIYTIITIILFISIFILSSRLILSKIRKYT